MKLGETIKGIFKNPITLWIKRTSRKMAFEYNFRKQCLKIGYMADITNCKFGQYNVLYDGVSLTNVVLGDFSYVARDSALINTNVGKFVSIGPEVLCGLGKHPSRDFVSCHPAFFSTRPQMQMTFALDSGFDEYAPIEIGNDVWIGARAIILDGVQIGDGAIIGAGALVTKDVPSYSIVGGVPAKVLRYRFEPSQIEFLKEIKWWDKDENWLRENYKMFHDIGKLKTFWDEVKSKLKN